MKIVFTPILVFAVLEGIIFYNRGLNWETLLFQTTMSGIEEEIPYKAILLSLLSTLLVNELGFYYKYLKSLHIFSTINKLELLRKGSILWYSMGKNLNLSRALELLNKTFKTQKMIMLDCHYKTM